VRPRLALVSLAVALAVGAAGAPFLLWSPLSSYPSNPATPDDVEPPAAAGGTATQPAAPGGAAAPTNLALVAKPVAISSPGFWSWALLDTRTGALTGSANLAEPSDTASMSKAWVAADYLRRTAKPSREAVGRLSTMIRDSDTTHTFAFHVANGNLASIRRMITMCGLTDTTGVPNSWSLTRMSARDAARLGACIADGRAAGPRWTGWLLGEMRSVRGPGRFGAIEVAPAGTVAAKNGWLLRDDKQWHIACMAVGDGWTLGVMVRHAGTLGKDHGAGICRQVAEQLRA